MTKHSVLMSSPEHFKVEYSINPWMVAGVEVDLELAKKQWNNLKNSIFKIEMKTNSICFHSILII